jgi:MFS family permease
MSAFGLIGIAFGIGFVLGPGASGYLFAHYGYQVPILCAAGLSLASILGTAFLLPSVAAHPEAAQPAAPLASEEEAPVAPGGRRLRILDWKIYGTYFRRPVLGGLLWEFFLYTFAFAVFMGGFALFAERRQGLLFGTKQVGYVLTYSGMLGVLIQGSIRSKRVQKFGEVNLVTLGFALGTIGYALLGFAYGIPLLLVAATFSSMGNGLVRPALTSLITQQVGREEQGVVLGLNQSLQSISQIVGQGLAGFLIDHRLLSTWAFWAAGVTLVALILNRGARGERIATTQGA